MNGWAAVGQVCAWQKDSEYEGSPDWWWHVQEHGCLGHCCCAMLCSTYTTLPCSRHAELTSQDGSSSGSLNMRKVARNSLTLPSATCSSYGYTWQQPEC